MGLKVGVRKRFQPMSERQADGPVASASHQKGGADDIVVIITRREGQCAECGEEFFDGAMIRMQDEGPLCLDCADLGHLEYLSRGNTALTRRATKHSPLRAVVVQWARARNHYERQGILVTRSAIDRSDRRFKQATWEGIHLAPYRKSDRPG